MQEKDNGTASNIAIGTPLNPDNVNTFLDGSNRSDLMIEVGANLGMPHTRSMSAGLFELRVKGKEGIARVFYCTKVGKRIIMLHGYVKKTQKTPSKNFEKQSAD